MSVVGFDLGTQNCVMAAVKAGGIDVLVNEVSKRETPAVVTFGEKERAIGESGAVQRMRNLKNSCQYMKSLVGLKYADEAAQRELKQCIFAHKETENGGIGITVNHCGEEYTFSPEQILGMLLTKLKQTTEKELNSNVRDIVVSVPTHFTEAQRRGLLDSVKIAGLKPLKIINDTTAAALLSGFYKTDLPEKDPLYSMFVDFGHTHLSVSVVSFLKGKLKVLANAWDSTLGGREFTDRLVQHFAKIFQEKTKLDVFTNNKSLARLAMNAEKAKKVLSSNDHAVCNVEFLMNDIDFSSTIKRSEYLELVQDLLDRVLKPVEQALTESGISKEQIKNVEVFGGSHRIPAFQQALSEFMGKELSKTLNASECIAKGCALQCAILSPVLRVKEFKVEDWNAHDIALSWDVSGSASGHTEDALDDQGTMDIFPRGNQVPSLKALTFNRYDSITLTSSYSKPEVLCGKYVIQDIPAAQTEEPKIKVRVRLDPNFVFRVQQAELFEVVEVEEPIPEAEIKKAEKKKPEEKKEKPEAGDTDKPEAMETESTDGDGDGDADGDAKMDEAEPEAPKTRKRKKVIRHNLTVNSYPCFGLETTALQDAVEVEGKLRADDKLAAETGEARNALESYIYDFRSKLSGQYYDYVEEAVRNEFRSTLEAAEDWLYEDGEDVTKSVYVAKLNELKAKGTPIELRYQENMKRPEAVQGLTNILENFKTLAASQDAKYAHITEEDRNKVLEHVTTADSWLQASLDEQAKLPKTADPVVRCLDIAAKGKETQDACAAIMNKPKPPEPKPEPTENAEAAAEEKKEGEGESATNGDQTKEGDDPDAEEADSKMDVE